MDKNEKILRLLEENAHYTHKNIADAMGMSEAEVTAIIEDYEKKGEFSDTRHLSTGIRLQENTFPQ